MVNRRPSAKVNDKVVKKTAAGTGPHLQEILLHCRAEMKLKIREVNWESYTEERQDRLFKTELELMMENEENAQGGEGPDDQQDGGADDVSGEQRNGRTMW